MQTGVWQRSIFRQIMPLVEFQRLSTSSELYDLGGIFKNILVSAF